MTASPRTLGERIFNYPKELDQNQALELILERRDAIRELSEMAYQPSRNEEAWDVLQRGLYRINWSHQFFGFNLYERFIVNAANEVMEKHTTLAELPGKMDSKAFRTYCHDYFEKNTTANHPLINYLSEGRGSIEQWQIYNKGLFYRGRSFHTHVALLSLHLDFTRTIMLYRLLGDEGGGSYNDVGNVEKSHGVILTKFMIEYLKMAPPDTEAPAEFLASQAQFNWIIRCATHPNPAWGIANLFCMEFQAFLEMKKLLAGVRARKVPDHLIEFFTLHGESYDPEGHVDTVENVFEMTIKTEHDQRVALTTINRNLAVYNAVCDGMWSEFQRLGLTGVP